MPADVFEDICFAEATDSEASRLICFSAYQRELNKLYIVASPIIESIYGTRLGQHPNGTEEDAYATLAQSITERLWTWQRALPPYLMLDMSQDCRLDMTPGSKAHCLQSLALQLTFDSLLVILHRPFLTLQIDSLHEGHPHSATDSTVQSAFGSSSATYPSVSPSLGTPATDAQTSSPQEWWNAAVRTSRVTELPQLAQLATDSHLVAFLAINLFNAAIVMVVMALSDPLSDRAQEVKRTITRIFRLQQLLGRRSKLSMQSSIVLRNVIHLLLRREAEAILDPVGFTQLFDGSDTATQVIPHSTSFLSVKETLSLPVNVPLSSDIRNPEFQEHAGLDRASRLNKSLATVQRGADAAFHCTILGAQLADSKSLRSSSCRSKQALWT